MAIKGKWEYTIKRVDRENEEANRRMVLEAYKALRDLKKHRILQYRYCNVNATIRTLKRNIIEGCQTEWVHQLKRIDMPKICETDNYYSRCKLVDMYRDAVSRVKRERKKRQQLQYLPRKKPDDSWVVMYKTCGGVLMKPNTYLKLHKKFILSQFFDRKGPDNNKNHVGIEIEFYCKNDRELSDIAWDLYNIDKTLINKINIKNDGSLRPKRGERDVEIAIVDTEKNIFKTLKLVTDVIQKEYFRVGTKCGLHVHLDMRNRDENRSFHNLCTFQKYLYQMQPARRKEGEWAKPVRGKDIEKHLNKRIDRYSPARYKGINPYSMVRHTTLEIRMHDGTVDYNVISNWVKLLLKIVDTREIVKRCPPKIDGFFKKIKLDCNKLKCYVEKRIEQHAA